MQKFKFKINLILPFTLFFFGSIFFAAITANRDLDIGSDTKSYAYFYRALQIHYSGRIEEPLFLLLAKLSYLINDSHVTFFFIISFLIFVLSIFSYYKMVGASVLSENGKTLTVLLAFSFMLFSPFFLANQINIIRQGVSIAPIIIGACFLLEKKYIKSVFVFLFSIFVHGSSFVFIVFSPLIFFPVRFLLLSYFVLSSLYLSGFSEYVVKSFLFLFGFSSVFYEIASYGSIYAYDAGTRVDFWLFTTLIILLSGTKKVREVFGERIIKISLVFTFPFLLIGFINFSDRLLVVVWSIIPVILATFLTSNGFRRHYSLIFRCAAVILVAACVYYVQIFFTRLTILGPL